MWFRISQSFLFQICSESIQYIKTIQSLDRMDYIYKKFCDASIRPTRSAIIQGIKHLFVMVRIKIKLFFNLFEIWYFFKINIHLCLYKMLSVHRFFGCTLYVIEQLLCAIELRHNLLSRTFMHSAWNYHTIFALSVSKFISKLSFDHCYKITFLKGDWSIEFRLYADNGHERLCSRVFASLFVRRSALFDAQNWAENWQSFWRTTRSNGAN